MSTIKDIANFIPITKDHNVFNIKHHHFSNVKNGDLLGLCNVVAFLRKRENREDIKFFITDDALENAEYARKFRKFIIDNSDYLSDVPGIDLEIPEVPGLTGMVLNKKWFAANLWQLRGAIGDHICLDIDRQKIKKVCIFPVMDANDHTTGRNWSIQQAQEIIDKFSQPEYSDCEKYFCCAENLNIANLNLRDYKKSCDLNENLEHILTCSEYVGGDTGMTHFAYSLKNSPNLHYYTNFTDRWLVTMPFNFYRKKSEMYFYR